MLFHITANHSYDTCHTHDGEKQEIQRDVFSNAENNGMKVHFHLVNRLEHATYLLVEADSFEAIDTVFDPILELGHYEITPVVRR